MKKLTAFWTCSLLAPAAIVPLTTATSCSQTWGYKTPISIGSSVKGSELDPYKKFAGSNLYDLNAEPIIDALQSNYAIDVAHNVNYGYSLPQKWDTSVKVDPETLTTGETLTWNNGAFVNGSAGWQPQTSSEFTNGVVRTGTKKDAAGTKTADVSEPVISYKNNIQSTNIELVAAIGNSINQLFNYALQYQGSQIGTEYSQETEKDTNLAISWGQKGLTHGAKDSEQNRQFFESVFASNSVSGTSKSQAVLRPSHVEYNFVDFPIPAYSRVGKMITGVHADTKKLLTNSTATRPSDTGKSADTPAYWSSKSAEQTETTYNFRTAAGQGTKEERKYEVYTYTNVPVIVKFNKFVKKYVNPTINSGFQVSDFYSSDDTIKNTIGNSWTGALGKFSALKDAPLTPLYNAFVFKSTDDLKTQINPKATVAEKQDYRLWDTEKKECRAQQNDFIALLNYSYKECKSVKIGDAKEDTSVGTCSQYDTVTMTGISTIFPAYLCDSTVVPSRENTMFTIANTASGVNFGYIFDTNKVNNYINNLLQLLKRSSTEGMKPYAKDLSDDSKQLLKFLAFMLGDRDFTVNTANCIETIKMA